MIEVAPNLFVGNQADDEALTERRGWYVVHAARDPYHRRALGYTGRGAPKDSPEYLVARRTGEMMLNLLDPEDPTYIPDAIIDAALSAITDALRDGKRVLVHCNQGKSRAPTIAMLWMAKEGLLYSADENWEADIRMMFESKYPDYAPAEGMRLYAQQWLEKKLTAA